MHSQTVDEIAALLRDAPKAHPGDYMSLEEFAADLLGAFAEKVRNETTEGELVRRKDWYEHAVLRDLAIMDGEGMANTMMLRAWAMRGYVEAYRAFMEKLKKLMDRAKRLKAEELLRRRERSG